MIAWDVSGERRFISQVVPPDLPRDDSDLLVTPSPDGTRVSYLSKDQVGIDHLAVRDLDTGVLTPPWPTAHPLANLPDWTPDGRHVITVGDDGAVRSWDPATGALVVERRFPFVSTSGSIGWRPGGETVFLGLQEGGVAEVDADTLELVGDTAALRPHRRQRRHQP